MHAEVQLRELQPGHAVALRELLHSAKPDEIYDFGGEGGVETSHLLIDALNGLPRPARLFHAGSARGAATADVATKISASRSAGHFAVFGHVFDHASRFGPRDGMAFQLVDAVRLIATGESPELLHDRLAKWAGGRRDYGWTPEYVDAMWGSLQAPKARDPIIASGVDLSAVEIAGHALAWFGLADLSLVERVDAKPVGEPASIADVPGWRAYTFGRDLVETLCEGMAARPA